MGGDEEKKNFAFLVLCSCLERMPIRTKKRKGETKKPDRRSVHIQTPPACSTEDSLLFFSSSSRLKARKAELCGSTARQKDEDDTKQADEEKRTEEILPSLSPCKVAQSDDEEENTSAPPPSFFLSLRLEFLYVGA